MNAAELTSLLLSFAAVATVAVQIYSARTRGKRTAAQDSALTMEKLNNSISHERDVAKADLKEQARQHQQAIQELRREFDDEISELRKRHAEEIALANDRIQNCQAEVNRLYRLLYGPPEPTSPREPPTS